MTESTDKANDEHHRCLKECEDFKKSGGKIKVMPIIKREFVRATLNKKSPKEDQ